MIVRRFIAVFFPAAQFEVTTRITRVEKDAFRTDGKIITDPGWLAVYGREAALADDESGASLVPISPNEPAKVLDVEVKQNETKPPARFNEATLLSAMEGAGKLVDDAYVDLCYGYLELGQLDEARKYGEAALEIASE